MITEINESKILTKHVSCECKCKFDGRKCNSDQKVDYVWNPAIYSCENGTQPVKRKIYVFYLHFY